MTDSNIWSCNPADIPPWTHDDITRLHVFLKGVFGWPDKPKPTSPLNMTHPLEQQYRDMHFQHQDGGLYLFRSVGRSTENIEVLSVVYQHIWPFEQGTWLRPIEQWTPERFKPISSEYAELMLKGNREEAQGIITAKRIARKALEASTKQSEK
jgi:hypothetical protein